MVATEEAGDAEATADRATRPGLSRQSSARGFELLLLLSWRNLWTQCPEGPRLPYYSKAFDTINHSILFSKFGKTFSVR